MGGLPPPGGPGKPAAAGSLPPAAPLAFELVGTGPDVVLIPGTFSDRRAWLKQVGALSARFRMLLFDPRGVGDTPDPGIPFTPDDLVDDVLAAMDAAGVGRAHLVGHSLDAYLALLLAERWPERARRVVAVAPTVFIDGYLLSVMDHWEALAQSDVSDHDLHAGLVLQAFGRTAFDRLVPAVVREMDRRPPARKTILRYVECDRGQDLRGMTGRIDAPVLVVCGTDDALPGTGQARAVAEAVAGSGLELMDGLGHSPHIEAPAIFNRLVADFLTR